MFMADGIILFFIVDVYGRRDNPVVYLGKHPEGCSSAVPDKGQGALASFSYEAMLFILS
jgi:hypothetical protein